MGEKIITKLPAELPAELPLELPVETLPLTPSGSERKFFRLRDKQGRSLIYMSYTGERKENEYYYNIALFLKKLGLRVPRIYCQQPGEIYLEDLGDSDLCSCAQREDYYYQVIDQLLILHQQKETSIETAPPFDYSLYRWETDYFLTNLVNGYCAIKLEKGLKKELEADFHFLAETLAGEQKVLIHRDCQSKNILIKDGQTYFIDFQGMRLGLPHYDLASLLEDPYVELDTGVKERLLTHYPQADSGFMKIYGYCALQRLMQALGAYSYLGLQKNMSQYLQYIPNALNRLQEISKRIPGFDGLKNLLNSISSIQA